MREAVGWTSEALETACGWALYVAAAYAVLFVDIAGHGTLWSHAKSMWLEGRPAPAVAAHEGVRVITLAPKQEAREDGMNYNYLGKDLDDNKALVAVNSERQVSALTDVPADPGAKQDWKRSIKGELRTFAVYGNGSETTSAATSVASVKQAAAPSPAATVAAATPDSAYRQGLDAASRPAIAGRARALSQNGSDGVRNFKR